MIRKMIVPTDNTFVLHLPDSLIGKQVEIIAFSTDEGHEEPKKSTLKRTAADAITFYKKHGLEFSKLPKWTRDELYE